MRFVQQGSRDPYVAGFAIKAYDRLLSSHVPDRVCEGVGKIAHSQVTVPTIVVLPASAWTSAYMVTPLLHCVLHRYSFLQQVPGMQGLA
jgi:hypothetical protein